MIIHRHFIKLKTSCGLVILKKEYNMILLLGIIPLYIKITDLMAKN